jgi:hypothetical protein
VPLFGDPFHPDKQAREWLRFLWDKMKERQAEAENADKARRKGVWDYVKTKWSDGTWQQ